MHGGEGRGERRREEGIQEIPICGSLLPPCFLLSGNSSPFHSLPLPLKKVLRKERFFGGEEGVFEQGKHFCGELERSPPLGRIRRRRTDRENLVKIRLGFGEGTGARIRCELKWARLKRNAEIKGNRRSLRRTFNVSTGEKCNEIKKCILVFYVAVQETHEDFTGILRSDAPRKPQDAPGERRNEN